MSGVRKDTRFESIERFSAKVDRSGDCWVWTGSRSTGGYARVWDGKRVVQAHRLSYELFVGPIPDGLYLDHLCRNRRCVKPEHLEPVTNQENQRRGVNPRSAQTHCKHGHPFDESNTYWRPSGGRNCRECHRIKHLGYRAKAQFAGVTEVRSADA
jgi:hypothetical protein